MTTSNQSRSIDRRAFVAALLKQFPDALVVSGLGSPSYDVFAAGDRPSNFYLWGAMGGSTSVALGLAIAQPDKQVIAITGDGEQLMGLGSLATAAAQRPNNLAVVVLDNGHFGETGMQESHTSLGANLAAAAKAFGVPNTPEIVSAEEVSLLVEIIRRREGMTFAQVHISAEACQRALPPRDGTFVTNRFRQHLGFAPL
ncbi:MULTISPECIES: thiamine pyrophosphate-dependent enzyme [Ralstonia solanacearum species complex]|uniref:Aldehyde dehydrogenase n=2 Tax=Ralstonia solanacearum species complex TaxID=3116862 RepID=A0A0S4U9S0_RALSL|nr:thiamine pyrophosphate-dependent enzyme [Ralstonia pseudosolanacearum]AUS43974.1 aldehyde dehydrogenase [Ralstonia solanacearum]AVV67689.1 aldehyde dehydrogenase [Ralstonia solanacearum OE1-1]API78046.1 aldehyde dehydrogenase [Ralstonia pseudosolanacearum]AST89756.1 aldehyde dehydrogenase [Ralstonia pseudosolanacearum]AYA49649.1 aldehyde dehydrogenase [Ralstonia pseudosolanacearum]